jgi:hypothetical protein
MLGLSFLFLAAANTQINSEVYALYHIGTPISIFKAPSPYISPVFSNPYFNEGVQTWRVTDVSFGGSFQFENKYALKTRLGLEYSHESSKHGFPIVALDGAQYQLVEFELNRNILKLNLSRKFSFFDSKIIIEPKLKLIKVYEQFDYETYRAYDGATVATNREFDLDLKIWRNQYVKNSSFDNRDVRQPRFEYELNSQFSIYKGLSLNVSFKIAPRRYFVYDYVYSLRTYHPYTGELISSTTFYGAGNDDVLDGYGIKNTYISMGAGLVYKFNKSSKMENVTN